MVLGQKVLVSGAVVLLCFMLTAQDDYRGGGALPLELLRPRYGGEPRFPQDYVIGALGQGGASEESYRYARLLTASLAADKGTPDGLEFSEEKRLAVQRRLGALGVRRWRVGGGRVEPDGAVSFLVRFLGREQSITGELYLRKAELKAPAEALAAVDAAETAPVVEAAGAAPPAEEAAWLVDDVLLENPQGLAEGKYSPGGADMTAYERFF